MALSQQELSNTLKHLKRAPAPRVPVGSGVGSDQAGAINLSAIKLKKTGKRESLIEEDSTGMAFIHQDGKENNPEHNSIFKKHLAMFDHQEEAPEKHSSLPRVMPKPKLRNSSTGSEEERDFKKARSESFPRPQSGDSRDDNSNIVQGSGIPKMKPLPSLKSIGKIPPPKPTKPLILAMKVQKQYKNHKVIIAPKVQPVAEAVENGRKGDESIEEEEGEDIYDDICSAEDTPQVSYRPQPTPPTEPEPIDEDMYDDVEQLAETVKAELKGQGAKPPPAPIRSDIITEDGTSFQEEKEYGEDLYEGVEALNDDDQANDIEEENENERVEQTEVPPPSAHLSNKEEDIKKKEKEKREREKKEKELQKKREKEEQRRKKEEEKQEREKKKREEEERRKREKFDKDLKKAHKLKGNEDIIAKGTAKESFSGTGKELPCSIGTVLEVIVKENCPSGKWLVRNPQGHLGYVPSSILEIEAGDEEGMENLDEDLYECVDTFKSQDQPPSNPVEEIDDVYDDTLMEDEDLYDDIPGADM
ncbi:DNA ligase 1-like [Actinia tenebrosa]|uniref:DNA ligase 1-like n=1 Tax=Actinia tenebrosa TaxID=6105 RepID=A0A6P8IHL2_ACTTE|nr:DNA ligase 1-like [Actinia tenebrosa]